MVDDIVEHRGQYAAFVTILLTIIVLTAASVLVLHVRSSVRRMPTSRPVGTRFWYSVVTITTVGYGDFYPVTIAGRFTAMFIMFAGVGIIGALASILASLLVGGSAPRKRKRPLAAGPSLAPSTTEDELKAIKDELAVLHQMLDKLGAGDGTP